MIKTLVKFIIIFCIFSIPFSVYCQIPTNFTFTINSTDEIGDSLYIGEAYYLKQYRSATFENKSSDRVNGKYSFTGTLLYPTAFRIYNLNNKYDFSELVFIDTGYQEMNLIIKDTKIIVSKRPKYR